jgi:hypothetical protein
MEEASLLHQRLVSMHVERQAIIATLLRLLSSTAALADNSPTPHSSERVSAFPKEIDLRDFSCIEKQRRELRIQLPPVVRGRSRHPYPVVTDKAALLLSSPCTHILEERRRLRLAERAHRGILVQEANASTAVLYACLRQFQGLFEAECSFREDVGSTGQRLFREILDQHSTFIMREKARRQVLPFTALGRGISSLEYSAAAQAHEILAAEEHDRRILALTELGERIVRGVDWGTLMAATGDARSCAVSVEPCQNEFAAVFTTSTVRLLKDLVPAHQSVIEQSQQSLRQLRWIDTEVVATERRTRAILEHSFLEVLPLVLREKHARLQILHAEMFDLAKACLIPHWHQAASLLNRLEQQSPVKKFAKGAASYCDWKRCRCVKRLLSRVEQKLCEVWESTRALEPVEEISGSSHAERVRQRALLWPELHDVPTLAERMVMFDRTRVNFQQLSQPPFFVGVK